jgi:flavin-dependent dehydrogenase
MKYDLIVSGGGPGGLMAAKTAAGDGLKVLLVEKKKDLKVINRRCSSLFYIRWVTPDGYLEPVGVERLPDRNRFHWYKLGFSIDYQGPLVPYTHAIWISPDGTQVRPFKDELYAYYYDKEKFVSGLLDDAIRAGVTIVPETAAIRAENTPAGVKVTVRRGDEEKVLEGARCIAADGFGSKIVENLGLNRDRVVFIPMVKGKGPVMEGIECPIPEAASGHLSWTFNALSQGKFMMHPQDDGKWDVSNNWKEVAAMPQFASWFKRARIVRTTAFAATVRTPIRNPIAGNVMVIGDAATPIETWIQGAVACGFMASKTILREMNGIKANPEYLAWWQQAFYCLDPGYFRRIVAHHLLTWNKQCTDEEVDYIYKLFENQRVVPTLELVRNPDIIRNDRPALYQKVLTAINRLMAEAKPVLDSYPPGSAIFSDPDACLKPWVTHPGY